MNRRVFPFRIFLVYSLYVILAGLLQASWPDALMLWGRQPDLTLVLAVLSGYMFGITDGIFLGLAAGFIRDLLAGRALGLGMLLLMYAGMLASVMFRRFFRRNILLGLVQILIISTLYELILMFLTFAVPLLSDITYSFELVFRQMIARLPGQLMVNFLSGIPMIFILRFLGPYRRGGHKDDPDEAIVGDSVWRLS